MADDLKQAQDAVNQWQLGQTSVRYETGGRGAGTISTGKGDLGGVSYGAYQLSSKMGTLQEYLNQSNYQDAFKGLKAATEPFNAKWRELAKTDPEFAKDQHDFIKRTHFDVQHDALKAKGIDLSGRGKAVQDALWSTSVQFRHLTPGIFTKGLEEKFGKDYKLSELSDKNIVEAVQDYKIAHNNTLFSKSPRLWPGLLDRAKNEKADLVQLANYEETVKKAGQQSQTQDQPHVPQTQSLDVLKQADQTPPLLNDPRHVDYALFRGAADGVYAIDAVHNRTSDARSDQLAASLAVEARRGGLHEIDHVVMSTDARHTFAIQGRLDDPAHHRTHVETVPALDTPLVQSTQRMAQVDAEQTQRMQRQVVTQPQVEDNTSVQRGMQP